MQELPNELKEEYLRRATLLLENFGHTHVGHAGGQHAGGQHAGQVHKFTSSNSVSRRTPQVDTEVVQELEKLRDHVYRLVLSLLSLFNFFNLFDMFDLFHLVDFFNFFHLFNLFNTG